MVAVVVSTSLQNRDRRHLLCNCSPVSDWKATNRGDLSAHTVPTQCVVFQRRFGPARCPGTRSARLVLEGQADLHMGRRSTNPVLEASAPGLVSPRQISVC